MAPTKGWMVMLDGTDGVRIVSNVVGVPDAGIRIGMPVIVTWEEGPGGFILPRFEPAG